MKHRTCILTAMSGALSIATTGIAFEVQEEDTDFFSGPPITAITSLNFTGLPVATSDCVSVQVMIWGDFAPFGNYCTAQFGSIPINSGTVLDLKGIQGINPDSGIPADGRLLFSDGDTYCNSGFWFTFIFQISKADFNSQLNGGSLQFRFTISGASGEVERICEACALGCCFADNDRRLGNCSAPLSRVRVKLIYNPALYTCSECCAGCAQPSDCSDGNECTNDVCSNGECTNPNKPSGTACGSELNTDCDNPNTCNGSGTCLDNFEPSGTLCTDDVVSCTIDECNGLGTCTHSVSHALCDDDQYCNGTETCHATLGCQSGTAPDCSVIGDDGVGCTDDVCDPAAAGGEGACTNTVNHDHCDDGLFCNGAEICDAELDCLDGTPPQCSVETPYCDEESDACVECRIDRDCELYDVCVADACDTGECVYDEIAYGDIDQNGIVNIFDLFCVLDGFAGDFSTCTEEQCDIHGTRFEQCYGEAEPPCCPNGQINIFDLFAVLGAFEASDPCCGGTAPQGAGPESAGSITMWPAASPTSGGPNDVFEVEVYGTVFTGLAGYELAVAVTGGTSGSLELEELRLDDEEANFVFYGLTEYHAFDASVPRMGCALADGGVNSYAPKYLGTFVFRASGDAVGTFTVSLVEGDGETGTLAVDSSGETMLVTIFTETTIEVSAP